MLKRILVPLDGSPKSEQALRIVNELAFSQDIELCLMEVLEPDMVPTMMYPGEYMLVAELGKPPNEIEVNNYLKGIAGSVRALIKEVKTIIEDGDPAEAIVNTAAAEEVDMIVMVTHGYGPFEHLMGSSVSAKVARRVDCPVLAIRDNHIPKHFLIALEETYSEDIIDTVYELAKLFKAKVTLTTVRRPKDQVKMSDLGEMAMLDPELAENLVSMDANRSEAYLQGLQERYTAKYGIETAYDVDSGDPGRRIPRVADRNGCDVIAMVTHGREGFEWLLKGSVTERVMQRTDSAMLVMHKNEDPK